MERGMVSSRGTLEYALMREASGLTSSKMDPAWREAMENPPNTPLTPWIL